MISCLAKFQMYTLLWLINYSSRTDDCARRLDCVCQKEFYCSSYALVIFIVDLCTVYENSRSRGNP